MATPLNPNPNRRILRTKAIDRDRIVIALSGDKKKIQERYLGGLKLHDHAAELGISAITLREILRGLDIECVIVRGPRQTVVKDRLDRIEKLLAYVLKQLDVDPEAILKQ